MPLWNELWRARDETQSLKAIVLFRNGKVNPFLKWQEEKVVAK
jgi:hypothetical protein